MNAIKERILGAVTVMDNSSALKLWDFISNEFSDISNVTDWDNIPEVEPDEFDLQMLKEIDEDKDCQEFISSDEAKKILGLV